MTLILVIAALPLGWFIRHRLTGYVVYLAAQCFLFTFQSTKLILEWANGHTNAFGNFPKANAGDVWSYGVVNLIILAIGLGVLALGQYLAARRRSRRTEMVALAA
jgi:hypothetical protein